MPPKAWHQHAKPRRNPGLRCPLSVDLQYQCGGRAFHFWGAGGPYSPLDRPPRPPPSDGAPESYRKWKAPEVTRTPNPKKNGNGTFGISALRAQLMGPPKSYRDCPPGLGGHPDPKIGKKLKMGSLESARRGGSEKTSFAMDLVKKKLDHFQQSKKFSAPSVMNGPVNDALSPTPAPQSLGGSIDTPPKPVFRGRAPPVTPPHPLSPGAHLPRRSVSTACGAPAHWRWRPGASSASAS